MRKILPIFTIAFLIGLFVLINPLEIFATYRSREQRIKRASIIRAIFSPSFTSAPTVTVTPTPTVTPTQTPTPTVTPVPTYQPTATSTTAIQDPIQMFIINAINDYRKSVGLSMVQMNKATCDFAKVRAEEIAKSFNHDGFSSRIDNKSLPYASYSQITENIAQTGEYTKVVSMWIASSGHAENMRKDTPFVCVERNGDYYAYEGWKP